MSVIKVDYGEVGGGSESLLNGLIPIMTSNTTPSGVASASTSYGSTYSPYQAFCASPTNGWDPADPGSGTEWVQYKFTSAVKAKKCRLISTGRAFTLKVKASNDGTNFTDLTGDISVGAAGEVLVGLKNNTEYLYYRFNVTGMTSYGSGIKIQLYG